MKIEFYSWRFWMWLLPQTGLCSVYAPKYTKAFCWLFWAFHYAPGNAQQRMKKSLITIISIMALASCSLIPERTDYPGFATESELMHWVANEIHYLPDEEVHNRSDYWQGPYETMDRRTGDCEDYAILTAWLIKKNFGKDIKILFLTSNTTGECHAAIDYQGKWLSPEGYMIECLPSEWTKYLEVPLSACLYTCDTCFESK